MTIKDALEKMKKPHDMPRFIGAYHDRINTEWHNISGYNQAIDDVIALLAKQPDMERLKRVEEALKNIASVTCYELCNEPSFWGDKINQEAYNALPDIRAMM